MTVENLEIENNYKKDITVLFYLITYFYYIYILIYPLIIDVGLVELTPFLNIKISIILFTLPIYFLILIIIWKKNNIKVKYIIQIFPQILILFLFFPDPTSSIPILWGIIHLFLYIFLIITIFTIIIIKNYKIFISDFNEQSVKEDKIIHINAYYVSFSYIIILSYFLIIFLDTPIYSMILLYLYFPLKKYFKIDKRKSFFFDNLLVKITTYLSFILQGIMVVFFLSISFIINL